MKFRALYLAGSLIAAAIPLLASIAPAAADQGSAISGRQAASATPACPPGYYWEPDGYARHGKYRPAHCAPRY
jgi:hypothetical protein